MKELFKKFLITGKVCIVTGGTGLLGKKHVEAIFEGGGIPVVIGRSEKKLNEVRLIFENVYDNKAEYCSTDITDINQIISLKNLLIKKYGHIDVLINNAANNPKMESESNNMKSINFENFPIELWQQDIAVGLTAAFECCRIFGCEMAKKKSGVILNISSDYGIRAPDQRIYKRDDFGNNDQLIKPVSYTVVKHAIHGLSKYLAAYWGNSGVRTNTLCPSGILNRQSEEFIDKYIYKVPLGRMSKPEDYTATILYLISDASAFMNGATVILDGGKSIW